MVERTSIGPKIVELRKSAGLTLKQVADTVGCTAAHISQIEHDKVSPSIATLKKIAHVLGVRIVDFFADEFNEDVVVFPPEKWLKVSLEGWRADIKQMVPKSRYRNIQPFYTIIKPGGGSREVYYHQGEEFGLVLEGCLTLKVGEEEFTVPAGSSFSYSSMQSHSWTNNTQEPCRVVWVVTPPSW